MPWSIYAEKATNCQIVKRCSFAIEMRNLRVSVLVCPLRAPFFNFHLQKKKT